MPFSRPTAGVFFSSCATEISFSFLLLKDTADARLSRRFSWMWNVDGPEERDHHHESPGSASIAMFTRFQRQVVYLTTPWWWVPVLLFTSFPLLKILIKWSERDAVVCVRTSGDNRKGSGLRRGSQPDTERCLSKITDQMEGRVAFPPLRWEELFLGVPEWEVPFFLIVCKYTTAGDRRLEGFHGSGGGVRTKRWAFIKYLGLWYISWKHTHMRRGGKQGWQRGDPSGCIEVYTSCVKAAFSLLTTRGRLLCLYRSLRFMC